MSWTGLVAIGCGWAALNVWSFSDDTLFLQEGVCSSEPISRLSLPALHPCRGGGLNARPGKHTTKTYIHEPSHVPSVFLIWFMIRLTSTPSRFL